MSSDSTTHDEGVRPVSVEEPHVMDMVSSEFVLEQLLELFSVDSSTDEDEGDSDANVTPDLPMPDHGIFERQYLPDRDISLTALHTDAAWAPMHLQAERPTERTHRSHTVSGPSCWIGLSVGWPETNVSFRRFGMVQWSHIPYISTSSQYMFRWTFQYPRAPLDLLNGVLGCDTEPGSASMLFYPDSLLPLPAS